MKYTAIYKQQIIQQYCDGKSISQIFQSTGIARSTLYIWVQPYSVVTSDKDTPVTLKNYDDLKRHSEKQAHMIEILKSVSCSVSSLLQEKLAALEPLYGQYSVYELCEALDVSRGTFYNHILRNKRDTSSYAQRRRVMGERIAKIHEETGRILGARKIRAILMEQGECISLKLVNKLMEELGLHCIRSIPKPSSQSMLLSKKENVLRRNFRSDYPNRVWVSDVTSVKIKGRYYYICVIIDLFSRKVVAFRIGLSNSTQLITSTFKAAYQERSSNGPLTFHSDQGSPYTSYAFQKLLRKLGIRQSFSNSGSPHDNAVAESFFATLKKEELHRIDYLSDAQFRRRVSAYINFFNSKRPHMSLNYQTLNQVQSEYRAITSSENTKLPGSDSGNL